MKKPTRGRKPGSRTPAGAIDPRMTKRYMVRVNDEQFDAYTAEAKRRGFHRGPHDAGLNTLTRWVLDMWLTAGPEAQAILMAAADQERE